MYVEENHFFRASAPTKGTKLHVLRRLFICFSNLLPSIDRLMVHRHNHCCQTVVNVIPSSSSTHKHNIATSHSFDVGRRIVLTAMMSTFFIVMQTFHPFSLSSFFCVNDVASVRNSLLPSGRLFVSLLYIRLACWSWPCHPWIQNEWGGEKSRRDREKSNNGLNWKKKWEYQSYVIQKEGKV